MNETFELFSQGRDLYEKHFFQESFEENIRFFAEECDLIQVLLFIIIITLKKIILLNDLHFSNKINYLNFSKSF